MLSLDRKLIGVRPVTQRRDLRDVLQCHWPRRVGSRWVRAIRHFFDRCHHVIVHSSGGLAALLKTRPEGRKAAIRRRRLSVVDAQVWPPPDVRRLREADRATGSPRKADGHLVHIECSLSSPLLRCLISMAPILGRSLGAGKRVHRLENSLDDLLLDTLVCIPLELRSNARRLFSELDLADDFSWDKDLCQVFEDNGAPPLPIQPRNDAVKLELADSNPIVLHVFL